jgi:hypothetical protein
MTEKPNFVLVPYAEPEPPAPPPAPGLLSRLRALLAPPPGSAPAPAAPAWTGRPRLVFGFDATASREPAWAAARQVTDALVRALPGALDVALAVHGGSRLHTFTDFTADPNRLRDLAAGIVCRAGTTRLLPILARSLSAPGLRVVVYIGDVFEESPGRGRRLADEMGRRGIRLIVLHDTADWMARRDAEVFLDLARRTGGCVLPFDANAPQRLREILGAAAAYAVGGAGLLRQRDDEGARLLLRHLSG